MRALRTAACALVVVAAGCDRGTPSVSDVASLDNFSQDGTIRLNQCHAPGLSLSDQASLDAMPLANAIKVDASVPADQQLGAVEELKLALSAVPAPMQAELVRLGGRLTLHGDIDAACSKVAGKSAAAGAAFKGCYQYTQARSGALSINILVDSSPRGIRHSAVRAFGYLYSQLIGALTRDAQGKVTVGGQSAGFLAVKMHVAESYVHDLATSSVFAPSSLAPYFDADKLATITVALTGGASNILDGADQRQRALGDMVFAEAFDSFYCNQDAAYDDHAAVNATTDRAKGLAFLAATANTAKILRDFFPRTEAAFSTLAGDIMRHAGADAQAGAADLSLLDANGGYTYYPSYNGRTNGEDAGSAGSFGNLTYGGSYVGPNGYYDVYNTPDDPRGGGIATGPVQPLPQDGGDPNGASGTDATGGAGNAPPNGTTTVSPASDVPPSPATGGRTNSDAPSSPADADSSTSGSAGWSGPAPAADDPSGAAGETGSSSLASASNQLIGD